MNNKLKIVGVTVLSSLALVGCNSNNDVGMNDNNGVQPTGYNDNINNNNDRINNNMASNLGRNQTNNNVDLTNEDTYKDNNNNGLYDNNNNQSRYEVANQAADQITSQIPEVDNAYVLATNNNAYVAIGMDGNRNNGDISDSLKQRITNIVKQTDSDIDNVYISSNPDFVNLSNNYVNDVNNGRPVRGFFNQFSNMIQRIFPDTVR